MTSSICVRAAFIFVLLFSTNSFAANFVVTTELDSGAGSLRQAILDANANGNPLETDTITFDPGVKAIELSVARPPEENGQMDILESVHIQGSGPDNLVLDGHIRWVSSDGINNGGFPDDPGVVPVKSSGLVFEVGVVDQDNSGISFTLSDVKVTRTGGMVEARAGADVTILNVVARENAYDPFHPEGLITHEGSGKLTIKDCEFSGNKTMSNLVIGANVLISNTTMTVNASRSDYGVWTTGDSTDIVNSQILDNDVQHRFDGSLVYITNSVIRNTHQSFVSLVNVVNAEFYLTNSTIYANTTRDLPGDTGQPSHLWVLNSTLHMANSVIAPEPGTHPFAVRPLVSMESGSSVALNTNNHVSDGSLPGTKTGDAKLDSGPFVDPFVFTPVMGSTLIDGGSDAHAIDPVTKTPLAMDIFGADRIAGPNVDIGAVEVQANHAYNDYYSTMENTILVVTAPGVFANDNITGTPTDGFFLGTIHPQHGTLDFHGQGGGFVYTPEENFTGIDKFSYFILTLSGDISNEGTVTISVTAPPVPIPTLSFIGLLLMALIMTLIVFSRSAVLKP